MYVLDEPKAIEKKLKSAVTDSGSEVRRAPEKPGVSNLIEILAAVRGAAPARVEADFCTGALRRIARRPSAAAVVEYLDARCASATASCAPTSDALEAMLAAAR